MSKNSVLYHFGIREQFKTSFVYKSMMSDLCLHFWLVSRILSPETHTSKKLELGSLMSKNSVLYHFGIRKRFRTSFVYITMMSELCLQFWCQLRPVPTPNYKPAINQDWVGRWTRPIRQINNKTPISNFNFRVTLPGSTPCRPQSKNALSANSGRCQLRPVPTQPGANSGIFHIIFWIWVSMVWFFGALNPFLALFLTAKPSSGQILHF